MYFIICLYYILTGQGGKNVHIRPFLFLSESYGEFSVSVLTVEAKQWLDTNEGIPAQPLSLSHAQTLTSPKLACLVAS